MTAAAETGGAPVTKKAPRCGLCRRLLRDEESKRLGFGPRCFKRLQRLVAPRPNPERIPPIPRTIPGQLALIDDKAARWDGRTIHEVQTGDLL
ncbi:DUF6011 domain-containing protein [Streptomyces sp. NPDC057717]|uniref:DUF6011 domain-containing protein n=1 Tax=Streptomyces sp. NPDC057717 TaxID=3346224 RepID=UPI0036B0CAC4